MKIGDIVYVVYCPEKTYDLVFKGEVINADPVPRSADIIEPGYIIVKPIEIYSFVSSEPKKATDPHRIWQPFVHALNATHAVVEAIFARD